MSEHPNATTYRTARSLLMTGDVDKFLDHVSESILWWEADMAKPLNGKPTLARHLNEEPKLEIRSEIHDVLANEEHLVALIHAVAETSNGDIDLSCAEVIHMEDTLIVKRQIFPSNLRVAASFYGIVQ